MHEQSLESEYYTCIYNAQRDIVHMFSFCMHVILAIVIRYSSFVPLQRLFESGI